MKNHNLGFEVPYRYGSETRSIAPTSLCIVDDGRGEHDLLHLVVEIKGYRGEDAKEKKSTMDTYWVPGVNHLGTQGRWAFAEFADVWQIGSDFESRIEAEFNKMVEHATAPRFESGDLMTSERIQMPTANHFVGVNNMGDSKPHVEGPR